MKIAALIVAAGAGQRAGGRVPKQYANVAGKPMLCHAIDAFEGHPDVSGIFLVVGPGQEPLASESLGSRKVDAILVGGEQRQDSVKAGLDAIAATGRFEAVLIHDAARPDIPAEVVSMLVSALETSPAAVPVLPVADTLARDEGCLGPVVDRAGLVRVQTPQAFHLVAAMTSHANWCGPTATDDAQMARKAGFPVAMVAGSSRLDKVTHPADFDLAETRMTQGMISRSATGYDVHRLEDGEDLWLCGIKIPHDQGLSGHSDADVALHALVDALLGTISEGDIGSHFPPSDPQWRGAPSRLFVEHARDLILSRGGIIDHVDVTLICERPKLSPHRDAMRQALADMLQLSIGRVSVKATTTEGLGFAGRGEGIAAQAIATVRSR